MAWFPYFGAILKFLKLMIAVVIFKIFCGIRPVLIAIFTFVSIIRIVCTEDFFFLFFFLVGKSL